MEPSYSIQGGLLEHIGTVQEEDPTTSVCRMFQNTLQLLVEFKHSAITFMELNFKQIKLPAFSNIINHNVPCAVCYTAEQVSKIMIPGKFRCMPSWTREYYGYLMTERSNNANNRNSYKCVDVQSESIPGVASNGALFYFTEATCNGISCPPYVTGSELTCVVCTK